MKNRPIHENLDTSFVNLSALIRYLRRRQFIGHVRIELSGYEADIYLTAENLLRVREYDHIAGRIVEGEEALQRIFIRSREPGGIINVYQTVAETEVKAEKKEAETEKHHLSPSVSEVKIANLNGKSQTDLAINGKTSSVPPETLPKPKLPDLPFEFSNKYEAKAKPIPLSAEEQNLLFNLLGELLGTVDRSLGMAKLNFSLAFQRACAEIYADYPFLKLLKYNKGKIILENPPNAKILVNGILEALRRILHTLNANPKFSEVYHYNNQRILALIHQRKLLYDKFFITPRLQKILKS
jgi:hypothetical protein